LLLCVSPLVRLMLDTSGCMEVQGVFGLGKSRISTLRTEYYAGPGAPFTTTVDNSYSGVAAVVSRGRVCLEVIVSSCDKSFVASAVFDGGRRFGTRQTRHNLPWTFWARFVEAACCSCPSVRSLILSTTTHSVTVTVTSSRSLAGFIDVKDDRGLGILVSRSLHCTLTSTTCYEAFPSSEGFVAFAVIDIGRHSRTRQTRHSVLSTSSATFVETVCYFRSYVRSSSPRHPVQSRLGSGTLVLRSLHCTLAFTTCYEARSRSTTLDGLHLFGHHL